MQSKTNRDAKYFSAISHIIIIKYEYEEATNTKWISTVRRATPWMAPSPKQITRYLSEFKLMAAAEHGKYERRVKITL